MDMMLGVNSSLQLASLHPRSSARMKTMFGLFLSVGEPARPAESVGPRTRAGNPAATSPINACLLVIPLVCKSAGLSS